MKQARVKKPLAADAASPSPLPLRAAAMEVLRRVLDERLFLDAALARAAPRLDALAPGDRIAARRIVVTALRRLGEIDAEIDARLAKPLPARAGAIRHILRVAAAETAFLGGPAHAAVDAAVRQAKRVDARLAGLVNAVSRRIAEAGPRLMDRPRLEAGRLNTPDWLWRRLCADWGEADAARIAAAHLSQAPLDLTLNAASANAAPALEGARPDADGAAWAARLGGAVSPSGGVRLSAASDALAALPGYAEGAWWVQDAAAALPARLLGDVAGRRALDLCAAPGGKTLQLAAAGAQVAALDLSSKRLERVRENLSRARLEAEIIVADALTWRPAAPFERVLLDAPCSASGTIRRHPELPWIKDGAGVAALAALQDALLDAAWAMTAPGGRMVFCTCSLFKEEAEARAEAFIERAPEAMPVSSASVLPPEARDADDRLRLRPCDWADRGGADGFFAAAFDKP
ncbi:MAG: transcription antitermination factor NusB [Pseudomonadota bacterium]